MTTAEYSRRYAQARRMYPAIQFTGMRRIKRAYREAAVLAADAVRSADDLANENSESWMRFTLALEAGADIVCRKVQTEGPRILSDSMAVLSAIDADFLKEAFTALERVTAPGIDRLFDAANKKIVDLMLTRDWPDGLRYADRVWGRFYHRAFSSMRGPRVFSAVATDHSGIWGQYYDDVINLVHAGIEQGRDVIHIARDIEKYLEYGKDYVFTPGRYGKLVPGTREYSARIGRAIDYRALRLVRSELYAGLQDAGAAVGYVNPGVTNEYDWILSPARMQWPCVCPDYARNGPYQYNQIPGYPHPNCMCQVRPVLRDHDAFIHDLSTWQNGGDVDYLDYWYQNDYIPAQG